MHLAPEKNAGTCPYKQGEDWDCLYCRASGLTICNIVNPRYHETCGRYYRMAELKELMPELWTQNVCCYEYRRLMLDCAEESGCMAGAIDVRKYPNDGKGVWRNYERIRLRFCPFCGQQVL